MSDVKLGQILDETAKRDAVHVAIAPVIAAQGLQPGDHVGFLGDGTVGYGTAENIGIVDPYLKEQVYAGERFYLFLYPNTVTGMRHQWSHPSFQEEEGGATSDRGKAAVEASIAWIKDFAGRIDQDYDTMMSDIRGYLENGEYIRDNTQGYDNTDSGDWSKFWLHYAVVTGIDTLGEEYCPYTCSC